MIAPDALELLRRYSWPGNVRELQRVLSAAIVLGNSEVTVQDLPEQIRAGGGDATATAEIAAAPAGLDTPDLAGPVDPRQIKELAGREAQRLVIVELQKRAKISQHALARLLGVDPKTLRSRLREIPSAPSSKSNVC